MNIIYKGVRIGNQDDYEGLVKKYHPDWAVIHACKEPYHRQLLGYKSQGAPKEDPEYLFARRGDVLYLNLIDAPLMEYIPGEVIIEALRFIDEMVAKDKPVLIHCNQGESRAPGIGFLWLLGKGEIKAHTFEDAERQYRIIYPEYNPKRGMRDYCYDIWKHFNHDL